MFLEKKKAQNIANRIEEGGNVEIARFLRSEDGCYPSIFASKMQAFCSSNEIAAFMEMASASYCRAIENGRNVSWGSAT